MSTRNVILRDKDGNQLAPATIVDQVSYDGTQNVRQAMETVVIVGNNTPFTKEYIPGNAILQGTFVLDSLYEMSPYQVLRGAGCVVTVSGNNAQIKLNNNAIVDGINFMGGWNPTRIASSARLVPILTETALSTHANTVYAESTDIYHSLLYTNTSISERIKIINCNFENINKCCIFIMGGDHLTQKRSIIANNHFQTVWCGVAIFSEFCSLSANIYDRCITGNSISSGNVAVTGQIFKQCDCGIFYGANGGNSAHNEVSGCEIAHSGLFGIYIKNITTATGNVFSGTQIVDAPIKAETANDLVFVGGRIDTYIIIDSGANNMITNNIIGDAYLYDNPMFTVPSDTLIYGNTPLRSTSYDLINPSKPAVINMTPNAMLTSASGKLVVDKVNRTARIYIMGTKNDGNIGAGIAVFNVPEEYCPAVNFPIPLILTINGSPTLVYGIIKPTGEVYINVTSSSNGFYGVCEYSF